MKSIQVLIGLCFLCVCSIASAQKQAASVFTTRWKETIAPADRSFESRGTNRFFVLQPGYQLVLQDKEEAGTQVTITVLNETRLIGGVQTRVVEERETVKGKLVEVSRNFMAIGAGTHDLCYFGEEVDMYKDGKVVKHDGAWLAGRNGARHGILIPGKSRRDMRYYQEQAPGVAMDRAEHISVSEKVTTPAGTFQRCLKVKETTPLEPSNIEYKYYAPGVGLIRDGGLALVRYGFVK